jgi:hypothetical protein
MRSICFFLLVIFAVLFSSAAFIVSTVRGTNNVMQKAIHVLPEPSDQEIKIYQTEPNTLVIVLEGLRFTNATSKDVGKKKK